MSSPTPLLPPGRPYAALPAAWAALVLVLTLTPADDMPEVPKWELLSFDTAAHAFVFLLLAALLYFSLRRQQRYPALRRHAWLPALLGSVAFGALIEVLQMTMRLGRHGEWSDVISDALGAGAGVLTGWVLMRVFRL
ncbi:VanZ family protein [Hymenobacter sp. BT175]|nr:VanZ family protein [Hymenobacter translucens]